MRPVSEVELAEAVRGAKVPLRIVGGGTRGIGAVSGEMLETSGLAGVTLYEPGALTLVAGAGTPLADIEALLAGERQRLPFEVPDMRGLLGRSGASTLGGVVAANASGPRRVQVGACRDLLLGVRFVDGCGCAIKSGGRVMKNVTGYDLVKLMAGSWGTLGVITEVSFKLQAMPEAEATLCAPMAVGPAVTAMAAALGSPYDLTGAAWCGGEVRLRVEGMAGSVDYRSGALAGHLTGHLGGDWRVVTGAESAALWREVRDVVPLQGLAGPLWRVSVKPSDAVAVLDGLGGTAMLEAEATLCAPMAVGPAVTAMAAALGSPYDLSGAAWCGGEVRLRVEGMAGSVAYRSGALAGHLGGDWRVVTGAESAALWREVRDVVPLQGLAGPLWRVSVKPSDAVAVLDGLGGTAMLDWGGGLVWYCGPEDMRGRVAALGGHATLMRGEGAAFQPEAPAVARLTAGLRAKYDPRGIFNAGLMG